MKSVCQLLYSLAIIFVVSFCNLTFAQQESLTIFVANEVVTMDATNPSATAIAVRGTRVVAVGSMDDLKPWMDAYPHQIDHTFSNHVLVPGLIDPHLHPVLGAIQLKTYWITPERWELHDETVEAVTTSKGFWERLRKLLNQESGKSELFIAWGWSEPYHGPVTRSELDWRKI